MACSISFASDITNSPQSFNLKNQKHVYTDFLSVHSEVNINTDEKQAHVTSTITFETQEDGYPLFDLVPEILSAKINGSKIDILKVSSPKNETSYRKINKLLSAGRYTLTIEHKITKNIEFKNSYINMAFWMSDLSDRRYVEQYLPSNLEYDHYSQSMRIQINSKSKISQHDVYANGEIIGSNNDFTIYFPAYFTASSFYLHITKKGRMKTDHFEFTSINGNIIPVKLYGKSDYAISGMKAKTKKYLKELERNFGAWSHRSLVIYMAGIGGGMEHSGATVTSERALGHEIIHSFFARGVMPVNGNAGWLDEAIASWRDDGYKKVKKPNFSSTSMSAHSEYRRYTDRKAYKQGANFMAFLNYKLSKMGGLKSFLKVLHDKYTHKSISTEIFKKEIEKFSGLNFTKEFNRYIFGNKELMEHNHKHNENPYHPKLSDKQLKSLL